MAGSVYCVSPNLWPTWLRVNIQVASLVNQPHGTIRRSRTDGTIPRTPQSHEACVDAARESQASQASPSHDIRPAPLSPPRSSFSHWLLLVESARAFAEAVIKSCELTYGG